MLNDTGPRCLCVGIVYSRISLEIRLVQKFCLKAYGAVLQCAKLEIKVCVNCSGIDDLLSQLIVGFLFGQIIHTKLHLNALQHIGNHLRVAAHRNALI